MGCGQSIAKPTIGQKKESVRYKPEKKGEPTRGDCDAELKNLVWILLFWRKLAHRLFLPRKMFPKTAELAHRTACWRKYFLKGKPALITKLKNCRDQRFFVDPLEQTTWLTCGPKRKKRSVVNRLQRMMTISSWMTCSFSQILYVLVQLCSSSLIFSPGCSSGEETKEENEKGRKRCCRESTWGGDCETLPWDKVLPILRFQCELGGAHPESSWNRSAHMWNSLASFSRSAHPGGGAISWQGVRAHSTPLGDRGACQANSWKWPFSGPGHPEFGVQPL